MSKSTKSKTSPEERLISGEKYKYLPWNSLQEPVKDIEFSSSSEEELGPFLGTEKEKNKISSSTEKKSNIERYNELLKLYYETPLSTLRIKKPHKKFIAVHPFRILLKFITPFERYIFRKETETQKNDKNILSKKSAINDYLKKLLKTTTQFKILFDQYRDNLTGENYLKLEYFFTEHCFYILASLQNSLKDQCRLTFSDLGIILDAMLKKFMPHDFAGNKSEFQDEVAFYFHETEVNDRIPMRAQENSIKTINGLLKHPLRVICTRKRTNPNEKNKKQKKEYLEKYNNELTFYIGKISDINEKSFQESRYKIPLTTQKKPKGKLKNEKIVEKNSTFNLDKEILNQLKLENKLRARKKLKRKLLNHNKALYRQLLKLHSKHPGKQYSNLNPDPLTSLMHYLVPFKKIIPTLATQKPYSEKSILELQTKLNHYLSQLLKTATCLISNLNQYKSSNSADIFAQIIFFYNIRAFHDLVELSQCSSGLEQFKSALNTIKNNLFIFSISSNQETQNTKPKTIYNEKCAQKILIPAKSGTLINTEETNVRPVETENRTLTGNAIENSLSFFVSDKASTNRLKNSPQHQEIQKLTNS